MSIKESLDKVLELHESLNKETVTEDVDPVTIDSRGNIDSAQTMSPGALADALKKLVKYAAMLEEEDAKKASQETEADAPSKD